MLVAREVFEVIGKVTNEAKIIDGSDVIIKGMSPDRTTAIEITFKNIGTETGEYAIDIKELLKVLKRAKKKDKIELTFGEDHIKVTITSAFGKRKFKVPLYSVDATEFSLDSFDFSDATKIALDKADAKAIIDALDDIKAIEGDEIMFEVDETFRISSTSLTKEYKMTLDAPVDGDAAKTKISSDKTDVLKKVFSTFDDYTIYLKNEFPLVVSGSSNIRVGDEEIEIEAKLAVAPLAD